MRAESCGRSGASSLLLGAILLISGCGPGPADQSLVVTHTVKYSRPADGMSLLQSVGATLSPKIYALEELASITLIVDSNLNEVTQHLRDNGDEKIQRILKNLAALAGDYSEVETSRSWFSKTEHHRTVENFSQLFPAHEPIDYEIIIKTSYPLSGMLPRTVDHDWLVIDRRRQLAFAYQWDVGQTSYTGAHK